MDLNIKIDTPEHKFMALLTVEFYAYDHHSLLTGKGIFLRELCKRE